MKNDGTQDLPEQESFKYPGALQDRVFSREEREKAGVRGERFGMVRLRLELIDAAEVDEELPPDDMLSPWQRENADVLRRYGDVAHGARITRDIVAPASIPLFALHFVIQRAFGWRNSHLHHFQLPEERFRALVGDCAGHWGDLVGLLFRSPLMKDEDRFWTDDYEGGDPKAWMRRKYRGHYLSFCEGETFRQCREDMEQIRSQNRVVRVNWLTDPDGSEALRSAAAAVDSEGKPAGKARRGRGKGRTELLPFEDVPVAALPFLFEVPPGMLLERLPVRQLMAFGGKQLIDREHPMPETERVTGSYEAFMDEIRDGLKAYQDSDMDIPFRQPAVVPVTDALYYNYDYGDDWWVKITGSRNCADLVEAGRLSQDELDQAILTAWGKIRPVCIGRDGYGVMDDVGGLSGYLDFLISIRGDPGADAEEVKESLEWAKGMGWSRRRTSDANFL